MRVRVQVRCVPHVAGVVPGPSGQVGAPGLGRRAGPGGAPHGALAPPPWAACEYSRDLGSRPIGYGVWQGVVASGQAYRHEA